VDVFEDLARSDSEFLVYDDRLRIHHHTYSELDWLMPAGTLRSGYSNLGLKKETRCCFGARIARSGW
jgi:hypothetical protein